MKPKNGMLNRRALNIAEAADYACVSRATVRNWIVSDCCLLKSFPVVETALTGFASFERLNWTGFLEKYHRQPKRNGTRKTERLIWFGRSILKF